MHKLFRTTLNFLKNNMGKKGKLPFRGANKREHELLVAAFNGKNSKIVSLLEKVYFHVFSICWGGNNTRLSIVFISYLT